MARVRFELFAEQEGGTALWSEVQELRIAADGRYSVVLGAATPEGLPASLFGSAEARWLAIEVDGQPNAARVSLLSVPYAMKAADADTLGGLPVSAFALAPASGSTSTSGRTSSTSDQSTTLGATASAAEAPLAAAGSAGYIAKFTNDVDLGNSSLFELNGNFGIGTTTPLRGLHIRGGSGAMLMDAGNEPTNPVIFLSHDNFGSPFRNFIAANRNDERLEFFTAGDLGMTLKQNRIGLGITSPSSEVHVRGGTASIAIDGGAGTVNPTLFFGNNALGLNRNYISTHGTDERLDFVANGQLSLTIKNRSLGIGTTSPLRGLHIRGGSGAMLLDAGAEATNPVIFLSHDSFASPFRNFIMTNRGDESMHFYTSGTLSAVLKHTGLNLGSPVSDAKLDATGAGSNVIVGRSQAPGIESFSIAQPPPAAVRGDATATTGAAAGVIATSNSGAGFGLLGQNTATSDLAIGVMGLSYSSLDGVGVSGGALASDGLTTGVYGYSVSTGGTGVLGLANAATGDAVGVFGSSAASGGTGVWGVSNSLTGETFGISGAVYSNDSRAAANLLEVVNTTSANLLIGRATTRDAQDQFVSATRVFRVDAAGKGYFNGGTVASGADFAELIAVNGPRQQYQPGDVLVIDASSARTVGLSSEPYSTLVAGVYSTKPALLGSTHHMDDPVREQEIPVGVVGIVPTKVSAENGPIRPGDLLVSSSIPGHAMKGTDRSRMLGAVIGKAMGSLDTGVGVVEVLISLQ